MHGNLPLDAELCDLVDGQLVVKPVREIFGKGRALIIGVPGAFTPVCSQHVPSLIANADRMRSQGFGIVACVVTSDPFAMNAWRSQIDPDRKVCFLSDGNLGFCRALGLISQERDFFMGPRSQRYLMSLRGGQIETLRVERSVLEVSCTNPAFMLEEA